MKNQNDKSKSAPVDTVEPLVIETIREAITGAGSPAVASQRVKEMLTERHEIQWGDDVIVWLALLCSKWHDKTPDINAQAEGIAGGIMRQWDR